MSAYFLHNGSIVNQNSECPGVGIDCKPRPVVVIDPTDREQVERLLHIEAKMHGEDPGVINDRHVSALQAALREFANPTPPKPEEPTGLGAVVEDAEGTRWIRTHDTLAPWQRHNFEGSRYYDGINAVTVLSEGVS